MIGFILIGIGIIVLLALVPIPPLIIFGPQGWQIKIPTGLVLIFIGIYLEYGATIADIFGL